MYQNDKKTGESKELYHSSIFIAQKNIATPTYLNEKEKVRHFIRSTFQVWNSPIC